MKPTCTQPERGEERALYEMGMLSETRQRSFESHLSECAACAAEVEHGRRVLGRLSRLVFGTGQPPERSFPL